MPVSILEMMVFRLPIISTNVGGIPFFWKIERTHISLQAMIQKYGLVKQNICREA